MPSSRRSLTECPGAWQRSQNENTNGLLRQYFIKGSDFRTLKEQDVQAVVFELNQRPRKKYQFKSPTNCLNPIPMHFKIETTRQDNNPLSASLPMSRYLRNRLQNCRLAI